MSALQAGGRVSERAPALAAPRSWGCAALFLLVLSCSANPSDNADLQAQCNDQQVGACETLCNLGNEVACFKAANSFDIGVTTPPDSARALQYYERACNIGVRVESPMFVAEACCSAALKYACGRGAMPVGGDIEPRPDFAEHYAKRACALHEESQCCELLEKGIGMPTDSVPESVCGPRGPNPSSK